MTALTQKSLQNRESRISIELPPTADWGIESSASKMASKSLSNSEKIQKSNREASRLFCEMFSSLSSTTTILFPSETEASVARNLWGPTFRGKVLSIDPPEKAKGYGKLRSRRFSAAEQEAALLASDGIYVPEGTEVLILAGPRAKDFRKIRKIESKLGQDTLIILINARAEAVEIFSSKKNKSTKDQGQEKEGEKGKEASDSMATEGKDAELSDPEWTLKAFNNIFNYAPPAIDAGDRELLLYHEISDKWALVEKGKDTKGLFGTGIGSGGITLNTIWEGDSRPSQSQVIKILADAKQNS